MHAIVEHSDFQMPELRFGNTNLPFSQAPGGSLGTLTQEIFTICARLSYTCTLPRGAEGYSVTAFSKDSGPLGDLIPVCLNRLLLKLVAAYKTRFHRRAASSRARTRFYDPCKFLQNSYDA